MSPRGGDAGRPALVVFGGRPARFWHRLLKPGFRHCFVALGDGARWAAIDPLSHYTAVSLFEMPDASALAAFYRRAGLTVVETEARAPRRRSQPLALFTCVEAVKRLLGLRARLVLTPWQLYRHLERRKEKNLDKAKII